MRDHSGQRPARLAQQVAVPEGTIRAAVVAETCFATNNGPPIPKAIELLTADPPADWRRLVDEVR